ncbi:MAG TPA: FAD-binding oxidoreductase [Luteimonas sp.]|nr:FAD-binding oxidoreductase [Luteimonas sp.]
MDAALRRALQPARLERLGASACGHPQRLARSVPALDRGPRPRLRIRRARHRLRVPQRGGTGGLRAPAAGTGRTRHRLRSHRRCRLPGAGTGAARGRRRRGALSGRRAAAAGQVRGRARARGGRGRRRDRRALRSAAGRGGRRRHARRHLGRRTPRDVVLATGAWSPLLAQSLRLRWLRGAMQPGKGYSITWSRPALVPKRPMTLHERKVCVTTWEDGFRLGSTMEFSGHDASLNRRRLDALERGAAEYLRDPVGSVKREEWYGWRPLTWDDLPIIGRAPGHDHLWLATGHGMLGVSMSPATGRLLAELMTDDTPHIDPTPYAPERFT